MQIKENHRQLMLILNDIVPSGERICKLRLIFDSFIQWYTVLITSIENLETESIADNLETII